MSDQNKELEKIVGDYKYGFKTDVETVFDTGRGINEEVVKLISKMKNEPDWMLAIRLKAYNEFKKMIIYSAKIMYDSLRHWFRYSCFNRVA